ncbi:MAG: hypothetical protein ACI90V_000840 [Bacillariaceae sp.]
MLDGDSKKEGIIKKRMNQLVIVHVLGLIWLIDCWVKKQPPYPFLLDLSQYPCAIIYIYIYIYYKMLPPQTNLSLGRYIIHAYDNIMENKPDEVFQNHLT